MERTLLREDTKRLRGMIKKFGAITIKNYRADVTVEFTGFRAYKNNYDNKHYEVDINVKGVVGYSEYSKGGRTNHRYTSKQRLNTMIRNALVNEIISYLSYYGLNLNYYQSWYNEYLKINKIVWMD